MEQIPALMGIWTCDPHASKQAINTEVRWQNCTKNTKKTRYFTYLTLIKGLKRSSSWIVDGTVAWPLLLCSCKDLCKQTLSYTTTKNLCRIFVSFIYLNLKLNSIVCQETPYILYWSRIMVQSSMVEITLV